VGRFKAVIFDWDGTLFDSVKHAMKVYKRLFKILGIDGVRWKDFREEFKADYHKYYAEKGIPKAAFEAVDALWIQLYNEGSKGLRLVNGAKAMLRKLKKRNVKLGIVSNGSRSRIMAEIEAHGLAGFFDVVVTGDEIPEFKPSPKGVIYALRVLGVKPSEALYIGDMAEDIKAGRMAGVKTAAVASGIHTVKRLAKERPDYIMQDVRGIMQIVE